MQLPARLPPTTLQSLLQLCLSVAAPALTGHMVRVLLIRHAQSLQNAYMEGISAKIARGELAPTELNKAMRDAPENMDAGADSPLTEKGAAQADRLGEAWGPLLADRAKQGKLKVFVSPFMRTLATADPLMRRLVQSAPGFTASLLPAIMEKGGLTAADDFRKFDQIDALTRAGKRDEALAFLKAIEWQPMGMTGEQIEQRFRWTVGSSGSSDGPPLPGNVHVSRSEPWWRDGYESSKAAAARVREVVQWLDGPLREGVSGDTVVVPAPRNNHLEHWSTFVLQFGTVLAADHADCFLQVLVTHGGTIAALTEALLGFGEGLSADGIRNTSVSSLLMPSSSASAKMPRTAGSTGQVRMVRSL